MVPTFRARNARTAAATPMPPTSRLVDAHQAQVGRELVEEAAEPGLRLVERGDAHGRVGHRLRQRGARRARLEPGGQAHEGSVADAAAEPDEARCARGSRRSGGYGVPA